MHYGWLPLLNNKNRYSVDGEPEMAWDHIEVDVELQLQLVEYSALLVLNTKITSHKEAYHSTAVPRALVTLASLSLLGSPDQTFRKDAADTVKV